MALVSIPDEYDFSTEFPTWIIAYCPDINSWFCTNKRFFYYEYPEEFQCEKDAIHYFVNHLEKFVELTRELYSKKTNEVFLENTRATYTVYQPGHYNDVTW